MPYGEIEQFIRDTAIQLGIDPNIAVRVANSEGGVTEYARRGTFNTGSSWWPFQLHYGGEGYRHFGTEAGMGNDFTRVYGWQPGDPAAWKASVIYALNRARTSGWNDWYGAILPPPRGLGLSQWQGINRNSPNASLA